MKTHCVQSGECLATIAAQYGFHDYTTLWNAPENASLRRKRSNPNVLCPNDMLVIPDKRQNAVARGTDQKHNFQIKSPTVLLRLVVQDAEGQPYANSRYVLWVDTQKYAGCTDATGLLQTSIPLTAREGRLTIEVQEDGQSQMLRLTLALGSLDLTRCVERGATATVQPGLSHC